jgi:hypothetical protein
VEAVGNVPARFGSGKFEGLFEDDCGGYSIDVVVAMDLDLVAARYGLADTFDCAIHVAQSKGIMEIGDARVEKMLGGRGVAEAAAVEDAGGSLWKLELVRKLLAVAVLARKQPLALK